MRNLNFYRVNRGYRRSQARKLLDFGVRRVPFSKEKRVYIQVFSRGVEFYLGPQENIPGYFVDPATGEKFLSNLPRARKARGEG